ncbi:MAG: methyltransferase domain-containing protein [Sphingomicrobium sp.]
MTWIKRFATDFGMQHTMDLSEQRAWWDGAAKENAATAVLSNNARWNLKEFYASGVNWFDEVRQFASSNGVDLKGKRALDFGSGLGRMTAAIASYYDEVDGADISSEMVKQASDNLADTAKPPQFHVVDSYPLPFPDDTFDLVFSTIVVQHISAPHNLAYVDEFFRVCRPGGFVLFDAPDYLTSTQDLGPGIFLCPRDEVMRLAARRGAKPIGQRDFPATATQHWQYLFRKD